MTQSRSPDDAKRRTSRWARALRLPSLLLTTTLIWPATLRAEGMPGSPLAVLLAAAEEAADTEPDRTKVTRQLPAPKTPNEVLHAAIRAAVRDEVNRVAHQRTLAPGRSGKSPAASGRAGGGNANGNSDRRDPGELGALHGAATSAQQAKRNLIVGDERASSRGPTGTLGPPGQSGVPLTGAGAKQ